MAEIFKFPSSNSGTSDSNIQSRDQPLSLRPAEPRDLADALESQRELYNNRQRLQGKLNHLLGSIFE